MLSQAYTKMMVNNNVASSSSAMAQQANFWDPPAKNESPTLSHDENLQGLLK